MATGRVVRYRPFIIEEKRHYSILDGCWSLKNAKILPPRPGTDFPTVVAPPADGYQDEYPNLQCLNLFGASLFNSVDNLTQSREMVRF
jgi:hypothetical protein